jgi:predicted restriction endonuclease
MKLESTAETQPQLQPALLRLAAIISQYFFRHQGVAQYESRDAPEGKTDAPPPPHEI